MILQWLLTGPEHKKLQKPKVADPADFQQPAPPSAHRDPAAEQPDGAMVSNALPHANSLLLALRLQGVVLQPPHWNGGGKPGVQ